MSMLETAAMQVTVHLAEEKARRLADENKRLRGLLAIARNGLVNASMDILDGRTGPHFAFNTYEALAASDPDVQPESGE